MDVRGLFTVHLCENGLVKLKRDIETHHGVVGTQDECRLESVEFGICQHGEGCFSRRLEHLVRPRRHFVEHVVLSLLVPDHGRTVLKRRDRACICAANHEWLATEVFDGKQLERGLEQLVAAVSATQDGLTTRSTTGKHGSHESTPFEVSETACSNVRTEATLPQPR